MKSNSWLCLFVCSISQNKIQDYFKEGVTNERFENLEKIGEGGAATVFKVTDKTTGEILALKKQVWYVTVIDEVKIMMELNKNKDMNKYFVRYVDSYREKKHIYIVMEYLAYCSLLDLTTYLRSTKQHMTEPQIAYILRQIVEGVKHMHGLNIIHMDIRAANVLIGPEGQVKIIDFGWSRKLKFGEKVKIYPVGTLRWRAPEVENRKSFSYTPDVWSLGMTFFEMFVLDEPYWYLKEDENVIIAIKEGKRSVNLRFRTCISAKSFYDEATQKNTGFLNGRPTVRVLAKHEFLKLADNNHDVFSNLRPLLIGIVESNIAFFKNLERTEIQ